MTCFVLAMLCSNCAHNTNGITTLKGVGIWAYDRWKKTASVPQLFCAVNPKLIPNLLPMIAVHQTSTKSLPVEQDACPGADVKKSFLHLEHTDDLRREIHHAANWPLYYS